MTIQKNTSTQMRWTTLALAMSACLFSAPSLAAASCQTEVEFSTGLSSALKSALLGNYGLSLDKEINARRVVVKSRNNDDKDLREQLSALANIPEISFAQLRCEDMTASTQTKPAVQAVRPATVNSPRVTTQAAPPAAAVFTPAARPAPAPSPIPSPATRASAQPAPPAVRPSSVTGSNIPAPPAIIGGLAIDTPITECQASILFSATATPADRARRYESLNVIPSGQLASGAQLIKPFYSSDPRNPEQLVSEATGLQHIVKAEVVCP